MLEINLLGTSFLIPFLSVDKYFLRVSVIQTPVAVCPVAVCVSMVVPVTSDCLIVSNNKMMTYIKEECCSRKHFNFVFRFM